MAYKAIGAFDIDVLYEFYDDLTPFFEAVTEDARDIRVMEVGVDGEKPPELWHDDYQRSDGAWVSAGEFESIEAAKDAESGFPEGEALGVYDYADSQAKLMIRESGEDVELDVRVDIGR